MNILPIGLGTPEAHLEAEIIGNAAGLITIMRPAVGEYGSGGPLLSIPVKAVQVA